MRRPLPGRLHNESHKATECLARDFRVRFKIAREKPPAPRETAKPLRESFPISSWPSVFEVSVLAFAAERYSRSLIGIATAQARVIDSAKRD